MSAVMASHGLTASEIAARLADGCSDLSDDVAAHIAGHLERVRRRSRGSAEAERRAHERLFDPFVEAGLVVRHSDGTLSITAEGIAAALKAAA